MLISLCHYLLASYRKNRCRYDATEAICVVMKGSGDRLVWVGAQRNYLDKEWDSSQEFLVERKLGSKESFIESL